MSQMVYMKSFQYPILSVLTTRSLCNAKFIPYFAYQIKNNHKYSTLQKQSFHHNIQKLHMKLINRSFSQSQELHIDKRDSSGLRSIFEPKSVAIIGATDRAPSVGRTIVNNLIKGFQAQNNQKACKIYPINPTRKEVLGLPCYPSIENVPEEIELAVIVTPAKSCLDVISQCARKRIKSAIVISAGFKEAGPEGIELEKKLIKMARDANIRIIGPNCVGVMNPNYGLNATFAATMGLPGNVAFISQSGAMCTAILDWSLQQKIGFSAFVSIGSMADVHWGDLLDYLECDPNTKSILIYMEAIGDVNAFLSAAQKVGLKKPISVIKAGKTDEAAKAAASHTGSLAGNYASFEAAMHRVGIITADTIQELSDVTLFLSKQPQPAGPKLMIITNAGGPAVLSTDATIGSGAELAKLSKTTLDKLNEFLPASWSHSNPVDILGDAPASLYAKTLEVVMNESNADGILVVLSPQDVTDPTATAKELIEASKKVKPSSKKPIFAAWMGGESVKEGLTILSEAGIPTFSQPDTAAKTFGQLWKQKDTIEKLYGNTEFPALPYVPEISLKKKAIQIFNKVYADNRTLLTESESKDILNIYGIKTAQTIVAFSVDEAVEAAKKIDTPLYAVKLNSKTLTHKADVGGVQLNLKKDEIAKAFQTIEKNVEQLHGKEHFQGVTVQPMIQLDQAIELIIGSTYDQQFGPVLLFGSGGTMVEVYKDTALTIPPISDNLAEDLIKKTKIYKALKGGNGKRFPGVNISELKQILVKFSQMIVDLADTIVECDINPLLATKDKQFIVLDSRFVLRSQNSKEPIVSGRPYPVDYISKTHLQNVGELTIRPTLTTDKEALRQFYYSLSEETLKKRYLHESSVEELFKYENLVPILYPDFDRQISMAAFKNNEIIALCELERPPKNHLNRDKARLQIVVADKYQKLGVGKLIMLKIMDIAKNEGIKEISSVTVTKNEAFTKLVARLGWTVQQSEHPNNVVQTYMRF